MDDGKEQFAKLIALMGWSKSEAARQLHMTPAAINHLLNPSRSTQPSGPTLQLLRMIAFGAHPEAFDHRTAKLILGNKPEAEMVLREDYASADDRDILDAVRRAPPEEKDRLRAMIKTFLEGASDRVGYKKKGNR